MRVYPPSIQYSQCSLRRSKESVPAKRLIIEAKEKHERCGADIYFFTPHFLINDLTNIQLELLEVLRMKKFQLYERYQQYHHKNQEKFYNTCNIKKHPFLKNQNAAQQWEREKIIKSSTLSKKKHGKQDGEMCKQVIYCTNQK